MEYYSVIKKNKWSIGTSYTMDEIWKHYAKWIKAVIIGHEFFVSIFMKCLEWAKLLK